MMTMNDIKKDREREVEKNDNYPKFVDLIMKKIRFAPGRESINIHGQKKCRYSYGIILYYDNGHDIEYLCAQKKDTYEYYIFITGRYNDKQLWTIFNLMTHEERSRLLKYSDNFRVLWDDLWINHNCRFYRDDYSHAERLFNQIKNFIPQLIKLSYSNVNEPEWIWPKGQKNMNEHVDHKYGAIRAAIREFREETRINLQVDLNQKYASITEDYRGSNNFLYSTTYFIVPATSKLSPPTPIKKEKGLRKECISYDFDKLGWFTAKNAPVNSRRRELLLKIDEQIKSHI